MNNTALITGASSGIGKELCEIHASKGGDLVIVARRRKNLDEIKLKLETQYKIKVLVIEKDLSKVGAAKEIYEEVNNKKIAIDYLINNAGFGGIGTFHERVWESDYEMINVNILALTELTRYFLPDFVARKRAKILNVSSTASYLPGPQQAVYFASKAYVSSFSYALFEELRNSGISVTSLEPGATKTEFGSRSGMDKTLLFKNAYSAKKVAIDGYNGMLKGKIRVITGVANYQRIFLPLLPLLPIKLIIRFINKMQQAK